MPTHWIAPGLRRSSAGFRVIFIKVNLEMIGRRRFYMLDFTPLAGKSHTAENVRPIAKCKVCYRGRWKREGRPATSSLDPASAAAGIPAHQQHQGGGSSRATARAGSKRGKSSPGSRVKIESEAGRRSPRGRQWFILHGTHITAACEDVPNGLDQLDSRPILG